MRGWKRKEKEGEQEGEKEVEKGDGEIGRERHYMSASNISTKFESLPVQR